MLFMVRRALLPVMLITMVSVAGAQSLPVTPLLLDGSPHAVTSLSYSGLSDTQCDGSGTIYVHSVTRQGDSYTFSSGVTKLARDGNTEKVPISDLPGGGPVHVFQFAVAEDGSLHEIVRARNADDPQASPEIYYVSFDADGTFHSKAAFAHEFIPSVLLPLPNGDFFASGVTLKSSGDDIEEVPTSGIFGPDAQMKKSLRKPENADCARSSSKDSSSDDDADPQDSTAELGDDDNIYLLMDGEKTKIQVFSLSGQLRRTLALQNPFGIGLADGMWISGSRILVSYEGEADTAKDSHMYAVYDAQTGVPLRLYKPDFVGNPACFDAGQELTVLMPQKSSGGLAIGQAELQ